MSTICIQCILNRHWIARGYFAGSVLRPDFGPSVSKSACFGWARVNGKRKSSEPALCGTPLPSFSRCNPRDSEQIRSNLFSGFSVPVQRNPHWLLNNSPNNFQPPAPTRAHNSARAASPFNARRRVRVRVCTAGDQVGGLKSVRQNEPSVLTG